MEGSFKLDPFSGALFVFCNRTRDRIKILEWDGDGCWLYFKRLEKGRFRWPEPGEEATMTLSGEEQSILLSGAKVELKLRRYEVKQRRIMYRKLPILRAFCRITWYNIGMKNPAVTSEDVAKLIGCIGELEAPVRGGLDG